MTSNEDANPQEEIASRIHKICDEIMEHADSVQVVATFHDGARDVTGCLRLGRGNLYARLAAVREWLNRAEQFEREAAKDEHRDPGEDS